MNTLAQPTGARSVCPQLISYFQRVRHANICETQWTAGRIDQAVRFFPATLRDVANDLYVDLKEKALSFSWSDCCTKLEAEFRLLRNDARKEYARYGNTSTLPRLLLAGLDSIGEVGFIGSVAAKSSEGLEELFLTPCFCF